MSNDLAQKQKELREKIISYKTIAEANTVAILFNNPELFYTTDLKLDDYSVNTWRVYFSILEGCCNEGKGTIDDLVVGQWLEQHDSLRQKYEEYGGWQTIQDMKSFARTANLEAEIENLKKWDAVKKLQEAGFPMSSKKLSHYADIDSAEIYDELAAVLSDTFIRADMRVDAEDAFSNIGEFIDELNKGMNLGLPANDSPLLNAETGGLLRKGHITSLGGLSGVGKGLMTFIWCVTTCIEKEIPICLIINEESSARWKQEILIWYINNKMGIPFTKNTLRNGHYSEEVMKILNEAVEGLKEYEQKHLFTIVPMQSWNVNSAIKIMTKYKHLGVDTFVIDTLKPSSNKGRPDGSEWQVMAEEAVKLYDAVKPASLNVALLCTYQLAKTSVNARVYSDFNIGRSKAIVDVFSQNIMIRTVFPSEYPGEKDAIRVYRMEGKQKIPVTLDEDKKYILIMITKNRFGKANDKEIVAELDMGRNIYKEIGLTRIVDANTFSSKG